MTPDPRFPVLAWEGAYVCNIPSCKDATTGLPPVFWFYDSRFSACREVWENHLKEKHQSLDFARFPWKQNAVFNRLSLSKITGARLNIGGSSLNQRPIYSETKEYLLLFGVDYSFRPPAPPAVLVAPGEDTPMEHRGGKFQFLVYEGLARDDGAENLQTNLDRAVAYGYPAIVQGVPTLSIPWNNSIHGPLVEHGPLVFDLDTSDDSDSDSVPSLISVD